MRTQALRMVVFGISGKAVSGQISYLKVVCWCRSPRISPSAVSMSPSETSVLDQADPLREEDSDIFATATPRKRSPGSTTSSAAASTPASVSAPAAPAAAPEVDREGGAAAAAPSARSAAVAGDAAAPAEPAGTSGLYDILCAGQTCKGMILNNGF